MILVAYGTRPEIIKLFPVIQELKRQAVPFKTLFTGQHIDLFEDVRSLVPVPDYKFQLSTSEKQITLGQSFIKICQEAETLLSKNKFEIVLVQGDTTTAWAISQMAFYSGVKVGHVEAGLRTYDLENPFPEELTRSLISQLAFLNFAPTALAYDNLKRIGAINIYQTGNTIVDAVNFLVKEKKCPAETNSNKVLITLHRRENHPIMGDLFSEIDSIATSLPELEFVFPIHPNPAVQVHRQKLASGNINVIPPVSYPEMLQLVAESRFIISDSGGIQEEATCFNKKILIVRKTTERSETVDAGLGKLVGRDIKNNVEWALEEPPSTKVFPYGKGNASTKIVNILTKLL